MNRMNRGYVKLYRKSLDNDLIRNPVAWQFMCWCLLKATHKAHKQIVGTTIVVLQPGQLIFGRASAARELNSTERKIRTCLELLKKTDFLTIETTNKFSIITIVNWASYQDERPASDQQDDQEATSKRPADDHKQECKTHKAHKDIKTPCQVFAEDSDPYRLAVFMLKTLKENVPTLKEPNLQKWASAFDVAIRNDPRMKDVRFVAQVIKWACSDDFWKANIQSPGKLREKFDQLTAKMESVRGSRASPSPRVGMSAHGNTKAGGQERNYGQSVIPDWATAGAACAGGEENDTGK